MDLVIVAATAPLRSPMGTTAPAAPSRNQFVRTIDVIRDERCFRRGSLHENGRETLGTTASIIRQSAATIASGMRS